MSQQSYVQELISQFKDGSALTASTTPTSLLDVTSKYTFLYNVLKPGQWYLVKAHGRISNIITTPGTLTLELRMGPTSTIAAASSGAIPLNTTNKANVSWTLEWEFEVRATGASAAANIFHTGRFESESVFGAGVGVAGVCLLPASGPSVGTGFDSTGLNLFDLFGTWSLNNANSIQVHGFKLLSGN